MDVRVISYSNVTLVTVGIMTVDSVRRRTTTSPQFVPYDNLIFEKMSQPFLSVLHSPQ